MSDCIIMNLMKPSLALYRSCCHRQLKSDLCDLCYEEINNSHTGTLLIFSRAVWTLQTTPDEDYCKKDDDYDDVDRKNDKASL